MSEAFDFDREINREGTHSVKYDGRQTMFGKADVIPAWVADMDFAAPPAVTRALTERAQHPIYGYTVFPDNLYDALIGWLQRRHGWAVQRDWIVMCPGVVPSINAAVMAFTQPGEAVIVQPPVYFPFFSAVTQTGRKLIQNPLRHDHGRYTIDFDHLEQCARQAKLLLLCSPHNPVGRVWSPEELQQLQQIATRHNLIVFSDEIHHDLIYPGHRHHVLAAIVNNNSNLITAVAPSKTFNIPGLNLSALIIPDKTVRHAVAQVFTQFHVSASNPFSVAAFEAAYRDGEAWLTALQNYLQDTRTSVEHFVAEHLPDMRVIQAEGTYLLWFDCREWHMTDAQLKHFFIHKAGVGLNPGVQFGQEGSGFMRLNIGAPRKTVLVVLERIKRAMRG
ncbi:pyridoxal phosphate-dependent aminotransferase [Nitrosomonas sp. Is35]|uniref:MalY/PatB family protein n=1 Tax=unclassified Nitrosomonas TaxID=2609265 RepID=UPI00294B73FB|nr:MULTISPECIES: pyridoxal phosphate-dependent aminotransferase [unclassified Nitrosomonas]MDV6341539.1 pyridoxal phosphate-dependent aminotransferase [Nitrosomonas sp. Is24]MDV6347222.1 pyridoxal phosphate-dependent aminotransferase [Nitrosomonas sp. Is35]